MLITPQRKQQYSDRICQIIQYISPNRNHLRSLRADKSRDTIPLVLHGRMIKKRRKKLCI